MSTLIEVSGLRLRWRRGMRRKVLRECRRDAGRVGRQRGEGKEQRGTGGGAGAAGHRTGLGSRTCSAVIKGVRVRSRRGDVRGGGAFDLPPLNTFLYTTPAAETIRDLSYVQFQRREPNRSLLIYVFDSC
ncbi:unnamed protein product [Danaus chrysippus]|uniref:(African queen) hypothetical protein n=1 Tax=Danaus chrysippus TaxID=151541 RepID=A0A8J2R5I2_9NEOP|nr:unnamed protein product [Danaus chrysippus]